MENMTYNEIYKAIKDIQYKIKGDNSIPADESDALCNLLNDEIVSRLLRYNCEIDQLLDFIHSCLCLKDYMSNDEMAKCIGRIIEEIREMIKIK